MAKITSKRQVTIPKHLADRYRLEAGQEIEWRADGEAIRVLVHPERRKVADLAQRLAYFDQASERQRQRQIDAPASEGSDRGWTREELYDRGLPR